MKNSYSNFEFADVCVHIIKMEPRFVAPESILFRDSSVTTNPPFAQLFEYDSSTGVAYGILLLMSPATHDGNFLQSISVDGQAMELDSSSGIRKEDFSTKLKVAIANSFVRHQEAVKNLMSDLSVLFEFLNVGSREYVLLDTIEIQENGVVFINKKDFSPNLAVVGIGDKTKKMTMSGMMSTDDDIEGNAVYRISFEKKIGYDLRSAERVMFLDDQRFYQVHMAEVA